MPIKNDCYIRVYNSIGLVASFEPTISADDVCIELIGLIKKLQDRD